MFLPMVLNSANPLLNEKYAGILMNINNTSKQYGLTITAEDAKNIVEVRNTVLRNYGRVDLGIAAARGRGIETAAGGQHSARDDQGRNRVGETFHHARAPGDFYRQRPVNMQVYIKF